MKKVIFVFKSEHFAQKYSSMIGNVTAYGYLIEVLILPEISTSTVYVFCSNSGDKQKPQAGIRLYKVNSHILLEEINACSC